MRLLFGGLSLHAHWMSPYQRVAKQNANVIPQMDYVWGLRLGAAKGQEAVVHMGTMHRSWVAKIQEGLRASQGNGPAPSSCEGLRSVWGSAGASQC
jgi:hypothetical protein